MVGPIGATVETQSDRIDERGELLYERKANGAVELERDVEDARPVEKGSDRRIGNMGGTVRWGGGPGGAVWKS